MAEQWCKECKAVREGQYCFECGQPLESSYHQSIFDSALQTAGRELKADDDLRNVYRASIAKLLYDKHGLTDDNTATEILDLIFP